MTILSLSPLTVLPCSPLEQIEAAHAAGFDAVGLRLQPTLATDAEVMSDLTMLRAIERKLARTRLQVLDIEVFRIGPSTDVTGMEAVLSYAGGLGARLLLFTSQPLPEYSRHEESLVVAKIGELCELAARHRIRPMIEFMAFRGIANLTDALRLVTRVQHQNLGICVDALHLCRSGGTPTSLSSIDVQLLASVQLCDAPLEPPVDIAKEARFGRLYPGEGQLPLRELISALPLEVPISVEAPCTVRPALSVVERAQAAAASTRNVLAACRHRTRL